MGRYALYSSGVYHRAEYSRHGARTKNHGQCHGHGTCLDTTQSVGMGIVARICRYDHSSARHYPTRVVLQTICTEDLRRHDQAPAQVTMDLPSLQTKKRKQLTHNL